ncbi:MAG: hypothetical protein LBC21_04665 [Oscillospiraceae bacterium]|jgi:hypothetical protein|nr:hypothetical protein [Oscillospiraceae bacterium]
MANVPVTLKARNASSGWDAIYPKTTLAQIIGLISGDKIDPSLMPDLAVTHVVEAASQTAMLALSVQQGDLCFRTDESKVYILVAEPASTLANWKQWTVPVQTSVSGNAGTATKLATARAVDGVSFDGSADISHYATCSTAAATVEKTAALTGFALATGAIVKVKFTVTNTANNPTLNISGTGAKAIYYHNAAIVAAMLAANRFYEFVYNGTQWELLGDVDTQYAAMSVAEGTAGTATTSRAVRADYLQQIIDARILTNARITAGATEPSSPNTGDIWLDYNNA